MMRKVSTPIKYTALVIGIVLCLLGIARAATGDNIDPSDKYAWSTNAGWVNFNPTHGGVTVYADHLEGYAWAERVGWIRLGTHTGGGAHHYDNTTSSNYGVNVDGTGNLSGYAWSANAGWINFNPTHGGVTIDLSSGSFDGYAWAERIGWIHFKNDDPAYNVVAIFPCEHPLTGVSLSGPASGETGDDLTFTANITPADATEPITYTWSSDGLVSGQGTITATYNWSSAGEKYVQVTARNCGGEDFSDSRAVTISSPDCPRPLSEVSIDGPKTGYTGTLYAFSGVFTPSNATEPITYTWSPEPESGQGEESVGYQWSTPGVKSLTLRMENCGGPISATHAIAISAAPPTGDAYEEDDDCSQAQPILTDGSIQEHTFHDVGDVDWVSFQAISGTEYLIEAVTPSDSNADVSLTLYDACGGGPTDNQDHSFSPDIRLSFTAPQSGTLYLRLSNSHPDIAGPDVSYHVTVRSLAETATPGALVLVAGRLKLGDPLQSNIHNVTNEVYNLFLEHGYDEDRIYYLATDTGLDPDDDGWSDVDISANRESLEYAITQWPIDEGLGLGPERAFTLYLMDHGGADRFYLNGTSQTVSSDDLDGWLDALEEAAPGVRVNVIMEACHSGSFVDTLSEEGRVVIASTAIHAVAYATQEGAEFSDSFVNGLDRGLSLYNSFEEARYAAETAHPDQTPWLDDDGDGRWNEAADGQEAARRGFAYKGTFAAEERWPPYVVWAQVTDLEGGEGVIEAEVRDDQDVNFVWAVVYKPSYTPPDPGETEEMPKLDLPTVQLQPQGNDLFSAIYEGFDETGEYRLVIYAADNENLEGRPKEVTVSTGQVYEVYLPLVLRE